MAEEVYLTVNGQRLRDEMDDLLSVVVDTSLNMPSMFSIELNVQLDDNTGKVLYIDDTDKFVPGQEVEIKIETDELADEPAAIERARGQRGDRGLPTRRPHRQGVGWNAQSSSQDSAARG